MNKTLGILALLLSGCIIYDQKGKCDNCDPDGYSDGNDGNGDQPDSGQDTDNNGRDTAETADPTPDAAFALTPDEGTVGTTFITHLTTTQANFDWGSVASVTLYNGVEILAEEVASTEIILSVRIPAGTTAASSDLLIETTDGAAHFVPDALTILPGDDNSGDPSNGDPSNTDTGC